jgi:hypothetical protein
MTQKINGAAYAGLWVEKKASFVKITFSKDIAALDAADLVVLGTTVPAGAGTVADSSFGVVESVVVQALKTLETKATVLGVSKYNAADTCVDVMLGVSEGWFSDVNGLIAAALPVVGAQAVVTTAGAAPTATVGALVGVAEGAVTFDLEFATWDGSMPVGTAANGAIALGVGATSGATPTNSPTGTAGYYPAPV